MALSLQEPNLSVPPILPSFFKVVIEPSRPHLPLPPDFVGKHLKNKISENPILQSVNGGYSWRVKFEKVDKVYRFADGWNRVVEDTQLVFGDFLVFWLVDHSTFKVLVFGTNGCEKHFPSNTKVEHEEEEEEKEDDDDEEEEDEVEEEDGGGGGGGIGSGDPFFMAIISKDYINHLWLPSEFLRSAGIDKERIITMKNGYGEEWRLSIISDTKHSAGRFFLSAGWVNFRRLNELSQGDECIIKYITSEDKLCLEKVNTTVGQVPAAEAVKRSRGRPPKRKKKPIVNVPATEIMKGPIGVEVVKSPRGRPRKRKKMPAGKVPATEVLKRKSGSPPCVEVEKKQEGGAEVVKRSRGRPRKRKIAEVSAPVEYFNGYF